MDEDRPGLIAFHTWPSNDAPCAFCGRTMNEMRALVATGKPRVGLCTPEGKTSILAAIAKFNERENVVYRKAEPITSADWNTDEPSSVFMPSNPYRAGREAGLREAAARFANLPGMMSGAAVAADILALIDAKELPSANE